MEVAKCDLRAVVRGSAVIEFAEVPEATSAISVACRDRRWAHRELFVRRSRSNSPRSPEATSAISVPHRPTDVAPSRERFDFAEISKGSNIQDEAGVGFEFWIPMP
jgi:hypothetical protein